MKQATAKELGEMIINELSKVEDCQGVESVGIRGQVGTPNWRSGGFVNYGEFADRSAVNNAAPKIFEKLQAEFELIPDNSK